MSVDKHAGIRNELVEEVMNEVIDMIGEISYERNLTPEEYQELGIKLAEYIVGP